MANLPYICGFCKAAESFGLDPTQLIKYAIEDKSLRNSLGESFGMLGGGLLGGAVTGTGIGALASILSGGKIKMAPALARGASIGAISAPASNVGAAIAALITKSRTKKEQKEFDSKSHLLSSLFVPGVGSYNMWKRLGRSIDDKS